MVTLAILLLAMSPMVLGSSEPQKEALLFAQADKDHNGELSEADLRTIFLDFDVNKDLNITKAEFINDWTTVYQLGNTEEATALFGRADTNDDGVISDADLDPIFAYFDMNGDNQVDLNEFLTQWGDLELTAPDTVNIVG